MMEKHLVDGERLHRKYPRTFYMLPRKERMAAEPGTFVKLGFDNPADGPGERLWFKVLKVKAPGRYVGQLHNFPVVIDLPEDAEVVFEARHILQMEDEEMEHDS